MKGDPSMTPFTPTAQGPHLTRHTLLCEALRGACPSSSDAAWLSRP